MSAPRRMTTIALTLAVVAGFPLSASAHGWYLGRGRTVAYCYYPVSVSWTSPVNAGWYQARPVAVVLPAPVCPPPAPTRVGPTFAKPEPAPPSAAPAAPTSPKT